MTHMPCNVCGRPHIPTNYLVCRNNVVVQRDALLVACRGILKHDVANLGTDDEFFSCYTYPHGTLPAEIHALKDAIASVIRKE